MQQIIIKTRNGVLLVIPLIPTDFFIFFARFYLHAHTLRVKTGCWQIHNGLCEKCDLHDVQDEKHVFFCAPGKGLA